MALQGKVNLITEGIQPNRKIIGLTIETDSHTIETPLNSWHPSPVNFLEVEKVYVAKIHYHRDQTLKLIKVGTLDFRKV